MGAALATTGINTSAIRALQAEKVVKQVANLVKFARFIGKPGDKDALIYHPRDKHLKANEKGGTVDIPLRRVDTGARLTPGYDYEKQGDVIPYSTSQLTIALRGRPFQAPGEYETQKSIIDGRAQVTEDAWVWEAADQDKFLMESLRVTTPQATFPDKSGRSASTNQYNVEYLGSATDWNSIQAGDTLTYRGLLRMKAHFQNRGIRPARFGGKRGYVVVLPLGAIFDLKMDPEFRENALYTLPSSKEHPFWSGWGEEFVAQVAGMWIFQDLRPAFGGGDCSFLHIEDAGAWWKFQGFFMGAQGVAYYKQKGPFYFERLWNHDQNFECSVRTYDGVVKPVLNMGAINTTTSLKDYGLGFVMGGCTDVT